MATKVKPNFCPPYEGPPNKKEGPPFSQGGATPLKGGEGPSNGTEELKSTASMILTVSVSSKLNHFQHPSMIQISIFNL